MCYATLAHDVPGLAISHNNLANYLTQANADPRRVAAHRLASLLLRLLMGSNDVPGTAAALLRDLARAGQPPDAVPAAGFADLCATLDKVEGTEFRTALATLPRGDTDGNTLLAEAMAYVEQVARQRAEPDGKPGDGNRPSAPS